MSPEQPPGDATPWRRRLDQPVTRPWTGEEHSDPLPPLYARWVGELLGGERIPAETCATCSECARWAEEDSAGGVDSSFGRDTKCCTFLPRLPNFLLGRILLDRDPESAAGHATVERRLAEQVGATPLGLGPSARHEVLYESSVLAGGEAFGRARSLRCPYYLADGRCGIAGRNFLPR